MKVLTCSWKKVFLLVTIIVFAGMIPFLPVEQALTISQIKNGDQLYYHEITSGESFELSYVHSIHRSPVKDTYMVTEEGAIRQTQLQYEDMAIGMPSDALFPGEQFVEENGSYFIRNMSREFPYIDLSTSRVAISHELHVDSSSYELHQFIEPGSLVRIEVKSLTLWQMMRGVKIGG